MIQIFFIATLSAIIIGVGIYLVCNKQELLSDGTPKFKPDKKYPRYHDYNVPSKSAFRIPQWLRDRCRLQAFEKGDLVINIQKEYPYDPFGELHEVIDAQYGQLYVATKFLSGEHKGKNTQLNKETIIVVKKQDIETPIIKVNQDKRETKPIKEGATVIAEYFMCYQRIIIEGKLLGYNQFGQPVISTFDCGQIIVAKNILKEVLKKRKK